MDRDLATLLLANAYVVTMDDVGTEHENGWILLRDGTVEAVGGGARPDADADGRPRRGSRDARPRQHPPPPFPDAHADAGAGGRPLHLAADPLSARGAGSTPSRSTQPHEPASRSSRSPAARPSSTTTTSFRPEGRGSSRPSFRRRASSVCGSSPRGARWTSASRKEGCRRTSSSRTATRRSRPRRRSQPFTRRARAPASQIAVAPCSPFSVTKRLMIESAELARRLGLRLHTHLAETVEEEEYCQGIFGCRPIEYLEQVGWLESRRLVRALRPSLGGRRRPLRRRQGPAWRTARPRTCASAPGSPRSPRCWPRASLSASASTAPPRTSAATYFSR